VIVSRLRAWSVLLVTFYLQSFHQATLLLEDLGIPSGSWLGPAGSTDVDGVCDCTHHRAPGSAPLRAAFRTW